MFKCNNKKILNGKQNNLSWISCIPYCVQWICCWGQKICSQYAVQSQPQGYLRISDLQEKPIIKVLPVHVVCLCLLHVCVINKEALQSQKFIRWKHWAALYFVISYYWEFIYWIGFLWFVYEMKCIDISD